MRTVNCAKIQETASPFPGYVRGTVFMWSHSHGGGQVLKKSLHCSNMLQETANRDTETALLRQLQYGFDPATHLRMCYEVKHVRSPAGFPRERLCSAIRAHAGVLCWIRPKVTTK